MNYVVVEEKNFFLYCNVSFKWCESVVSSYLINFIMYGFV